MTEKDPPDHRRGATDAGQAITPGRCPACKAPTRHRYRPFCSRRCAEVDLGRWFSGAYRIPTEDPDDRPAEPWDDDAAPDGGD